MPENIVLLVPTGLWGVEATCVILTNADLEDPEGIACQKEIYNVQKHLLILTDVLELVGSGDNFPCTSSIVVAAVVGNDSTAADEVVVLVENEAGPGELAGARLAMLEATSRCWEVPCSALLARINNLFVAIVSDTFESINLVGSWSNASTTKVRVVDRRVIAASLLTKGAIVLW